MKLTRIIVGLVASLAFLSLAGTATPSLADDGRKIKAQAQPVYPELAKVNHIGGSVKLEIVITPQGTVRTVKVLGGNPVLADAAERAVKTWKWEAGSEETRTVTVDFKQ